MTKSEVTLITSKVNQVLRNLNITNLPINPFDILLRLNIRLIRYSELPVIDIVRAVETSMDGFCGIIDGHWVIFYNDSAPNNRIRFTLMHELGHIILGHHESDKISERQANFFASLILMPRNLVIRLLNENNINIKDYELAANIVSKSCNVSISAARITIFDIKNRHLMK